MTRITTLEDDNMVTQRSKLLAVDDKVRILNSNALPSRDYIIEEDTAYESSIIYAYETLWFLVGTLEMLLAFRFVLKFLEANPFAGFSLFIYSLTNPFIQPFVGILPMSVNGNTVIEWPDFVAMAAYFFLGFVIAELIKVAWNARHHRAHFDYTVRSPRVAF